MKAIDNQIGGIHYKRMAFQPIELIVTLKCSFIQGCIIKYIARYKNKGKAQDLKKCIHYAQLAISLKDKKICRSSDKKLLVDKFVLKNSLTILHRRILYHTVCGDYESVIQALKELLHLEYPEEA